MTQFKHIPSTRIVSQESVDGRDESGMLVRYELVETKQVTYLHRYEDGIGVSTAAYRGKLHLAQGQAGLADARLALSQAWLDRTLAELGAVEALLSEPVAAPARQRGPNRPDAETPVWSEGGLAVVMVTGRSYRYELRRGAEQLASVVATRAWRAERQDLIAQAEGLLTAAA